MKKTLLILFLLAFSQVGKTQTYMPVIEENKYWQYYYNFTFLMSEYSRLYFFEGDSTILSNTYKKLYYYNVYPVNSYGFGYNNYVDFSQKYFSGKLYREDVDEKKIYVFEHPDIEYLVADFNLEIDDEYTEEEPSGSGLPFTVTNIEEITLLNGEIRKRWEFETDIGFEYMIEGLGYSNIIFSPHVNGLGAYQNIWCIHNFDTLIYKSEYGGPCAGHLSLEENEKDELKIKTYPNPVQDIFTIEFTESQNEPFQIQVFDVTGKLVLENNYEKSTQKVELNCQSLNEGMYFYTITQNNGVAIGNGKILINHIKQ